MIVYTDKNRVPFQIDAEDYEAVSRYPWRIAGAGYPYTDIGKVAGRKQVPLHVFLLGPAPLGREWDHANQDKRDNRRGNLRALTHSANVQNTEPRCTNTSGTKGVSYCRQTGRWAARVEVNGVRVWAGRHDSLEQAASAANAKRAEISR